MRRKTTVTEAKKRLCTQRKQYQQYQTSKSTMRERTKRREKCANMHLYTNEMMEIGDELEWTNERNVLCTFIKSNTLISKCMQQQNERLRHRFDSFLFVFCFVWCCFFSVRSSAIIGIASHIMTCVYSMCAFRWISAEHDSANQHIPIHIRTLIWMKTQIRSNSCV